MNLRSRLKSHPELHAGALNDILFILLFFFLIVSTLANPNVIKLSQPKSKSDTKAKQTVVVSIDGKNQFFVGTTKVSLEELRMKLQPLLVKEADQPTIVINADNPPIYIFFGSAIFAVIKLSSNCFTKRAGIVGPEEREKSTVRPVTLVVSLIVL